MKQYGTTLTPAMRAEAEHLLRISSEGLSHGAVFRLMERGLDVDEIARVRGVGAAGIKTWMESLEHLFSATLPNNASAALKNSYVYRYFLNHDLAPDFKVYTDNRLAGLKAINPKVSLGPLNTRSHQYATKKHREAIRDQVHCQSCAPLGLKHVGECY